MSFQYIPPDTLIPELVLIGGSEVKIETGLVWIDPGVEAHDFHDGNITDQVVVTGLVDTNTIGEYIVTYTVDDNAGNTANITRTVTVVGTHTVDLNSSVLK